MSTETETGPVDLVSERKESMAYFDEMNTPEVSGSPAEETTETVETAPEPEVLETAEPEVDETAPEEPKKRNKQSFQERINELTAARKSVEETAAERQQAWEQEKSEYEQRIRQYEQMVTQQQAPQQQPQEVADWYAQQGIEAGGQIDPVLQQQLQQQAQHIEQLTTWAQSQQEASRQMAERAVHAQRQREAQEASAKFEGVPVDLIDEIVSNNPQYSQSPGAADHVAREVLIRFYQWAEQRGLAPREQEAAPAEPGETAPEPLKRPKSAGARTDRDAKTEPDSKKRRRAKGPDKAAMAIFERFQGGG